MARITMPFFTEKYCQIPGKSAFISDHLKLCGSCQTLLQAPVIIGTGKRHVGYMASHGPQKGVSNNVLLGSCNKESAAL